MRPYLTRVFLFVLPVLGFLKYILPFYSNGELKLTVDARVCYIYNNYFLNNMARGVYPFWNPFCNWGRPDDFGARMNGDFNPLLYMVLPLKALGCPFSLAYFIYMIGYFLLGVAGFYLLAKAIFTDERPAYLAFLLLLFSNIGGNLFNDFLVVLIFVPAVWFFYFLVAFTKQPGRFNLLGMTWCAMMILTTYLPFHFLTALLVFGLAFMVIYWRDVRGILDRYVLFIKQHPWFTGLCILSVALAMLPGLLWYLANLKGDLMAGWRSLNNVSGSSIHMNEGLIDLSSVGNMGNLESFFSGHSDAGLNSFFIPVFAYICLGLGIFLKASRRMVALLVTALVLLFIAFGKDAPIYPWCYAHIFFFKDFRNLHFLVWGFAAFLILCACEQFRLCLVQADTEPRRRAWFIKIIGVHGLFLVLLLFPWRVTAGAYLTVFLSLFFFILYSRGFLHKAEIFALILLGVVLIQPLEVLHFIYGGSVSKISFPYSRSPYSFSESKPVFAFVRPLPQQEKGLKDTEFWGEIKDRAELQGDYAYLGTIWTYMLKHHLQSDFLKDYVRYKFFWYPGGISNDVQKLFLHKSGVALESNSSLLQVDGFDLDWIRLHTDFDRSGYLVYNDSYDPGWRAFLDDKPLAIQRANIAFKGMYVPAGRHALELRYQPVWRYALYFFLLAYSFFIFGILLVGAMRRCLGKS